MSSITNLFIEQLHSSNYKLLLPIISFIGGVIASISPCSLSMLPIIIGYIGGYDNKQNNVLFLQLISFIFGSSIIFSIIGIICALTGKVFISIAGEYFILIMASLLAIMGLNILGILDLNMPALIKKIPQNSTNSKYIYPMILGGVFALGGTPCSTPILAGIMSFASIANNIILAIIMLFMFSLGQGVILILAGMFTKLLKNIGTVSKYSDIFLKLIGIFLILSSIYLMYKVFNPYL